MPTGVCPNQVCAIFVGRKIIQWKLRELKYLISPKERTILAINKTWNLSYIFIKKNSYKVFWKIIKCHSWTLSYFRGSIWYKENGNKSIVENTLSGKAEGGTCPDWQWDVKNTTVEGRAPLFQWSPIITSVLAEYNTESLLSCLPFS